MIIPQYKAGYPRVTHPSATKFFKSKLSKNFVRLACVKHAASVHPEPGSNSQIKSFSCQKYSWRLCSTRCWISSVWTTARSNPTFAVSRSYFIILFSACQELFLKSFFKIFSNLLHNLSVLSRFGLPLSCSDFFYYTQLFEFVKNFFQLFFKFVSFHFYVLNLFSFKPAALRRLVLLYTFLPFCQHLFWKKFQLFSKT